jgi:hypothetical protein
MALPTALPVGLNEDAEAPPATLAAQVIEQYNRQFELDLTAGEKRELVEYLKSIQRKRICRAMPMGILAIASIGEAHCGDR